MSVGRLAILLHPVRVTESGVTPVRYALLAAVTALLAIAGMAAIWSAVALVLKSPCGWMAPVVAIDVALMLRLAGLPRGRGRAAVALGTALAALAAGAFAVAAISIGRAFGTLPHEAIWFIDPPLALTWWRFNAGWIDVLAAALALPLAWRLGR